MSKGSKAPRSEQQAEVLVELGTIGRAQGLRGSVRFRPYNADTEALTPGASLFVGNETRSCVLARSEKTAKGYIIRFRGCETRDAAERLTGQRVFVARSELKDPDEGEYYVADLLGLKVEGEAGELVGKVVDVFTYPTADCAAVARDDGTMVDVPLREPYLVKVDLEAKCIMVRAHEELPTYGQKGENG